MASSLKLRVGDTVMVRTGRDKGKTGKIVAVNVKEAKVTVDGVNVVKKHVKPTQAKPTGGIEERTLPIGISKVGIVHPTDKNRTSRIGYKLNDDGSKTRIYKANGKEIK